MKNYQRMFRNIPRFVLPPLKPDVQKQELLAAFAEFNAARNEEHARLITLLGGIAQAFWEADGLGLQIEHSPSWEAYTGQTKEDWYANGWVSIVHPDDQEAAMKIWTEGVKKRDTMNAEFRIRVRDGSWRWTNARAAPVLNDDGTIRKWVGMNIDITPQKQVQENLSERLSKIISQAGTGVVETDVDGRMTLVNQKFAEMLGYTQEEMLGMTAFEVTDPEFLGQTAGTIRAVVGGQSNCMLEKRYLRKDGSTVWAESSVNAIRNPAGEFQGLVVIITDISARKLAEENVRLAALRDPLTGLPNRARLFEYTSRVLGHDRRNQTGVAVLFLDLDRFKPINDTHGHETGDKVLKEVTRRLQSALRVDDMVARLGGDEFVVFLQDIGDPVNVAEVARNIITLIGEPYTIGSLSLSVTTSVGISMFPQDGETIEELIAHADMAMYKAKQIGRNNYQYFAPDYAAPIRKQLLIEQKLTEAVRDEMFYLTYQPVVDIDTGEVLSAEALLRWHHDDIPPDQFIPVAETTGLINPIGQWVLRQAAKQHRIWKAEGLPLIPIAINISVVEFRDPDFSNRFFQILEAEGLHPSALQLEITETAIMENVDHATSVLTNLKNAGVKILLDDFGTGYSSLSYLARLPLNKVKIDKSFIALGFSDLASRAITNAMIALGKTLGLEVVAEGVGSKEALEFIRFKGCMQAQGFMITKPLCGGEFANWYLNVWHHSRVT